MSLHDERPEIDRAKPATPTQLKSTKFEDFPAPSKTSAPLASNTTTRHEKNTSVPTELPLKRPKTFEEPLKRPIEREVVGFSEITAVFAVDVSGSTEGKVLAEEKDTVELLCSGLSQDSRTQARIIPWCDETEDVLRSDELHKLISGGGTIPNRLNDSPDSKHALRTCSAWFLLTDGEIEQEEVCRFSNGLCTEGLHGAPCVVILFGYKTSRPVQANISVGLSVFSHATDCLFLFHDIDTTVVYVLQSKGKFSEILPAGYREIILNIQTLWGDLPSIHYRQLFDVALPTRQQLLPDDLLLQSGKIINLEELYRHRLSPTAARDIMDNDDNLKSVLLAASIRGRDEDVARWVSKQNPETEDIAVRERADVKGEAASAMKDLVNLLFMEDKDQSSTEIEDGTLCQLGVFPNQCPRSSRFEYCKKDCGL